MQKYDVRLTHQAIKDTRRLSPKLKLKLEDLIKKVLERAPHDGKKLLGEFFGSYSIRLSYKDRIVYSIDESKKIVYNERTRTHYGE